MTEAEWLSCDNPSQLLVHLRGTVSERKLRLLACACCRVLWDHIPNGWFRRGIETTERYADGGIRGDKFASAFPVHLRPGHGTPSPREIGRIAIHALGWPSAEQPRYGFDLESQDITHAAWAAGEYAEHYTLRVCLHAAHAATVVAVDRTRDRSVFSEAYATQMKRQAAILRDVFGNPFRPVAFDPAWRTSAAVGVASQMYASRDFGAMPVLADALMDAGCEDERVLAHCRGDGPHVRGCWVVDLVLGNA